MLDVKNLVAKREHQQGLNPAFVVPQRAGKGNSPQTRVQDNQKQDTRNTTLQILDTIDNAPLTRLQIKK